MIYYKELEKLASMIKKFSSLLKTNNSPIFYLTLITLIYFTYVLKITNINGDWRHYIDSEILWPYNVLLILSDKKVDFSAYGYFYFILEYKFFQILDIFSLLKTTNITELNNSKNFSEKLENLIFAGRWFNVIIIYCTLSIAFLIFNNLIKNSILAFLLVLIFMFTPGMVQQISHARVDILASTLLFISYFYLIKFSEKKTKLLYILFITFFFLSVFTKVQSYLYLFTLLISSIYFIKHQNKILEYNNLNFWLKILLIIFISYCLIYPILFHRHAKFSLIFIYSQLLIINVYFYFVFINYKKNFNQNIVYTTITFLIILIFILIINNLSYMYLHVVRLTFFEPMEIRMYMGEKNLKGTDVITLNVKENLIYFYLLFKKVMASFQSTIIYTFTNFNSNFFLVILNTTVIFYCFFFKKITKDLFLLLPILSFFIINSISTMRGSNIAFYLTYSEFLLYIPTCIYLKKASSKLRNYILVFLIFTLLVPPIVNPSEYNNKRFIKSNRFINWCPKFLDDYTKQLSQKRIKEICY